MYIKEGIIIRELRDMFIVIDTLADVENGNDISYIEDDKVLGIIVAQLPKPLLTLVKEVK